MFELLLLWVYIIGSLPIIPSPDVEVNIATA